MQRRESSSRHILSALERGWKEASCEVASAQGDLLFVHQGPNSSFSAPAVHAYLQAALAWIGCFSSILAIGAVFGGITRHFSVPLMLASFGPTAALLYGSPSLPTAQPWNAMGKLSTFPVCLTCFSTSSANHHLHLAESALQAPRHMQHHKNPKKFAEPQAKASTAA